MIFVVLGILILLTIFLLFIACLGSSDMARREEQWEIERILMDEQRKSNKSKK